MKHTPKPWHIEKGQFSSAWFIHHLGSEVCMIPSYTLSQEANAHLIAAAPELLQACEEAVKDLEATSNGQGDEKLTVAKLKTAIKKATKEFPGVWGGIQSQVKALRHDLPFTVFKKRRSSRIEDKLNCRHSRPDSLRKFLRVNFLRKSSSISLLLSVRMTLHTVA